MPVPIRFLILGFRENVWAKGTHLEVIRIRRVKIIKWKGRAYQENVGNERKKTQDWSRTQSHLEVG